MRIVILGAGGSWPSPLRNVPAIAVRIGPEVVLLDCGEGTQRQFMLSPLSFMDITKIFITHFHGDHFLGIPGLLQSMGFNDRKKPITIYGPSGTEELVSMLLYLGYFKPSYEINAKSVKPGQVLEFGRYYVKVGKASHFVPALAYAIEEKMRPGKFNLAKAKELGLPEGPLYQRLQKGETVVHDGKEIKPEMVMGVPRRGRKLVYTGDTLPLDEMVEFAKGADVLIHDGTVDSSLEAKANEYGHSSARQAATIAKKSGARVLILSHISPRYEKTEVLEQDAKKIFENVIVAKDLLEYEVPLPE
jgi:ribonuclease Z